MKHLPVCVKLLEPLSALKVSSAGGFFFALWDVLDARHSNVARGTLCGANCTRVSRHGAGCPVPAWWNGRHEGLKIRKAQNTTSHVKCVVRSFASNITLVSTISSDHPKKNDLATCTQST